MNLRRTLLAAGLTLAIVSTAWAQAGFRLGNAPFRYVDNAPGRAYMPDAPTPSAYFRPTPTDADAVSRLAGQLDYQLNMNFRHDQPEYNKRHAHFRAAMDQWEKSPKGAEERGQMTEWLRTSMKYSMPGSHSFLPPLPQVNPIDQESDSTRAPGVRDPFRDDPVQMAPM